MILSTLSIIADGNIKPNAIAAKKELKPLANTSNSPGLAAPANPTAAQKARKQTANKTYRFFIL